MGVNIKYLVLCVANIIDLSLQAEWTYNDELHWPGVCRTGTMQSPINIMSRDAVVDVYGAHIRGPLQLKGYHDVRVTAMNNGHTLKWSHVLGTPTPVMSGGPLRGNYMFMQFHLHWLSEHAIDGMKYPLEIHIVHIKEGLTASEAVARPDGLAVVGILGQLYSGYDSNRTLDQITPQLPYIQNSTQGSTQEISLDISKLFSPEPQSYYTYHGSLTTPMCQEAVTWIVMDKPVHISDTQYKLITRTDVGGSYNFRSLQPVNRMIYRSVASCSGLVGPNIIGTFAGLLTCLSSVIISGFHKGICAITNIKRKIFGDKIKQYPLEIHIVHIKEGLTASEAVARPDGLAVVGILGQLYSGYDSNRTLDQITPQLPYIQNSTQGSTQEISLDISKLFSPEPQSYYTYHGSLTTPMCQEAVTWIVMDKPVHISDTQYKLITRTDVGGSYNFRSLQPVNRMIYRSVASCSGLVGPNIIGTFAGLLTCLSSVIISGFHKGICAITNIKRKIFGDKIKQCVKLN